MTTISLIGPMGAGKSTIGRLLAARLRIPFVDLDEQIVEQTGKSIPRIFEEDGECVFRAQEGASLEKLVSDGASKVLATGGGVIMAAPNRERLKKGGPVVWLDATPEVSAGRISGDSNRPLIKGIDPLQKARELDRIRRSKYEACADFRIDTASMAPEESVEAIAVFLSEYSA